MSAIVSDHRTLRGMDIKGFINRNGHGGSTERHWSGAQVKVITASAGPKLKYDSEIFTYKGRQYQLRYFDGCFHQFVTRVGEPLPKFV